MKKPILILTYVLLIISWLAPLVSLLIGWLAISNGLNFLYKNNFTHSEMGYFTNGMICVFGFNCIILMVILYAQLIKNKLYLKPGSDKQVNAIAAAWMKEYNNFGPRTQKAAADKFLKEVLKAVPFKKP